MEFYKTRQVLKARKIKLKKEGLGRKANASEAIEQDDEMKLEVRQRHTWDLAVYIILLFYQRFWY